MKTFLNEKSFLIIYAPGVFMGGGLVLLRSILNSIPEHINLTIFLDKRIPKSFNVPKNSKFFWVNPSIFGRLISEFKLFLYSKKKDKILSFSSLPVLIKNPGYTMCFQQNLILLQKTTLNIFSPKKELSFILKRLFLKFFKMNINEYIVQTPSMKKALVNFLGNKIKVRIIPFIDEPISTILKDNREVNRNGFIYVADGLEHKNHHNLLIAWSLLGQDGIRPRLFLTLNESYQNLLFKINELCQNENLNIYNVGSVSHDKIFEIYETVEALIYPSFIESLGLPLVEASQINLPIIASELDFVRDICNPSETFDPNSPVSIMRSVKRFINASDEKIKFYKTVRFLKEVGIE